MIRSSIHSSTHASTRSAARFATHPAIASVLVATLCCAAPAQTPPTARAANRVIAGVVVSGASGQPIEGADVFLSQNGNVNPVAESVTDAQGRFSFANLADGRFLLSATRRGYVQWTYEEHGGISTAIVTGENLDTTGIVFPLPPLASIYGTVTEDSGDPVPNAGLLLFRQSPLDPDEKQNVGARGADETGNFEFPRLAPGVYYLCASGVPWYRTRMRQPVENDGQPRSPLDVAYPVNCFSDSGDPAGAEPITIRPGDRIQTNLVLHAVPAMHVTIQVPRPEEGKGFISPMLRQNIFGFSQPVGMGGMISQMDGRVSPNQEDQAEFGPVTMVVTGVAPGQYDLQLLGGGPDNMRHGSVDLSSNDLSIDASSLAPYPVITGKVIVTGGAGLSASNLSLISSDREPTGFSRVSADGSFRMSNVPAGSYQIVLRGSAGMGVSQLRINGKAADGFNVSVGSAPLDLTVIAAVSNASVSGSVQRNGKPASGVFVLLAPDDQRASFAAWFPNQSDSDGSFVFEHVLPGAYHAVAVEQGWTLDWRRREVIAPYLARGVAVTVSANSRRVELSGAVEAQPQGGSAPK
jgi:Carboxypeptidase regulatory-like domain